PAPDSEGTARHRLTGPGSLERTRIGPWRSRWPKRTRGRGRGPSACWPPNSCGTWGGSRSTRSTFAGTRRSRNGSSSPICADAATEGPLGSELDTLDDAALEQALEALAEAERSISVDRVAVLRVHDQLQEDLLRRYREDPSVIPTEV